jgi:hypothetical protein
MINPKSEFQKDKDKLKAWANVVDSKLFSDVASIALAQMVVTQGSAPDMGTASAQAFRMEGAKIFLHVLMNIADSTPPPKPKPSPQLQQP